MVHLLRTNARLIAAGLAAAMLCLGMAAYAQFCGGYFNECFEPDQPPCANNTQCTSLTKLGWTSYTCPAPGPVTFYYTSSQATNKWWYCNPYSGSGSCVENKKVCMILTVYTTPTTCAASILGCSTVYTACQGGGANPCP